MGLKEAAGWLPVENNPGFFQQYKIQTGLPALDWNALRLLLLEGGERRQLKTPTNGDATLLLSYKKREGAVGSVQVVEDDLMLTQLQGAYQEGFRVSGGLRWVDLFANQIQQIAVSGNNSFRRITMPEPHDIEGIADAVAGIQKYFAFIALAGLRLSAEEHRYVRDLHI